MIKTTAPHRSLFTLFICLLFFSTSLVGQREAASSERWLGLHNVYYKNKSFSNVDTVFFASTGQEGILTYREEDKVLSFGLHYRVISDNQRYHQIDLINFERSIFEDFTLLEIIGQEFSDPARGTRITTTNIQVGYRMGKLFPLAKRLTADASIGGYPTYRRQSNLPRTSLGFPVRLTQIGLGLDIRLGLNYQIHPNINIGYSFVPVAGQWFWQESYVENPILTEEQRTIRDVDMEASAFEQVFDFRNISLRYVIPAEAEKRKERRGRRR